MPDTLHSSQHTSAEYCMSCQIY